MSNIFMNFDTFSIYGVKRNVFYLSVWDVLWHQNKICIDLSKILTPDVHYFFAYFDEEYVMIRIPGKSLYYEVTRKSWDRAVVDEFVNWKENGF